MDREAIKKGLKGTSGPTNMFEGVDGFKTAGTHKKLEITKTFRSEDAFLAYDIFEYE